ncbi:MAG: hypothetical protein LBC18_16425 [Opitutaceae bacterium]|jgi:hypothetical protein|nr:hypothetical protein [Opitutaceae bacterium]
MHHAPTRLLALLLFLPSLQPSASSLQPPASTLSAQPPAGAPILPLDDLRPGQAGEVWTVFQGGMPEPFAVEVAGVIRNALGPGKSLILCRLTDPRVQHMGAVAGMSGSPLYIDGKFAGALSYQVQRFETVRHAGFTPAADLLEVSRLGRAAAAAAQEIRAQETAPPLVPLTPAFAFGGIAPQVAALFRDGYQALGLSLATLGGHMSAAPKSGAGAPAAALLRPGSAVAVALATGDITLAGTGSVSHVDGDRILAFGHPLLTLGAVELPMALADIITILPSNLSSVKISNTGPVIGTIRQDRLSAIYGEIGPIPPMFPIEVRTPARTLHFSTIRHDRLTPMLAATGLAQAVLGSNENGLAEGFRIKTLIAYPGGRRLETDTLHAGPQGFAAGVGGLVRRLAATLGNPVADIFPESLAFTVEPLARNPSASIDLVRLSRTRLAAGDTLRVTLTLRDFQGDALRETIPIDIPADWTGRALELVLLPGDELDRQTGRPATARLAQIRTFDAYLDLMSDQRAGDGLYLAVVERASAFIDQTRPTLDYPGSLERIARRADDARYQKRDVLVPLWEKHILPGRLLQATHRQPLQITE